MIPSAFGATALPKKTARTTIVNRYGAICKNTVGTPCKKGSCDPITAKLCDSPKNRLESIAPTGFHFPKIMAARAMNPGPMIVVTEKLTEID